MTRMISLVSALLAGGSTFASVITQWDFNSQTPDDEVATGSTLPSMGKGAASPLGGVAGTFVTGDTKHDPAGSVDNSGWRTTKYPVADAANKTDGVRFDVDTSGYEAIVVSWYQQNSATASRYARVQYTLDGASFVDADVVTIPLDGVFTSQTLSLENVDGVANNPGFAFRIVTEWQSSATGSGADSYLATKPSSNYGSSGTIRFDMVTVTGRLIPGANTPPQISSVSDQILRVNSSTEPISMVLEDREDPEDSLTLSALSSDPGVMPDANMILGGNGSVRTLTLVAGAQAGTSTITLIATDPGGRSTSTHFQVTVLVANTVPVISRIPRTNTMMNLPTSPIEFIVGDGETSAAGLTLTGSSRNTTLVSSEGIVFGGIESNRTVSVIPIAGRTGVAPLCVTVGDGTNYASSIFPIIVTSSDSVIFCEPFDYSEGSIHTNSAFLWTTRSGKEGECQVVNGQLQLCSTQSEDIVGLLIGAPYAKTNNIALYASFNFNFTTLPNEQPGLFAHFSDGSILRGRLYAGTTNAAAGCYRLHISNGAGSLTELVNDLFTNQVYQVVLRYDVAAAITTVWLNPTAESDPATTADDLQTASPILSFGFRQDNDMGATILVDDLLVGLSFASVVQYLNAAPVVSDIDDQILRMGSSLGPLAFTVSDAEDSANSLTLSCRSSNPEIVAPGNVLFEGTSENRTVSLIASARSGSTLLTICATDPGGRSGCCSFGVTVLADNTPPLISVIPCTHTTIDCPSPALSFTIEDNETAAEGLMVSAFSRNPALIPDGNVILTGIESNRSLCVLPAAGKTGVAPIDVRVSDGTNEASATFAVMVTPSERVVFIDPFDYVNGAVLTDSSCFWKTRSGSAGECQVFDGRLSLRTTQREDVIAPLLGGPFTKDDATVLFASFRFSFSTLPKLEPGLFAHFADGNTLRGRIYAGTTNAALGCFRLQVANGSSLVTELPVDLSLNTAYTVVTRYDVATASTSLWLDPVSESDSSISGADLQIPCSITSYGFREDSDTGADLWVDDLVVGLSFAEAVPAPSLSRIPLTLESGLGEVRLIRSVPSFKLQIAVEVLGPYEDVLGAFSPYTIQTTGQARFFRLRAR